MFDVFVTVLIIFGTIVGAGFASGNEIVVFFTRFGALSYLFIAIAGVMFYFALYYLLRKGKVLAEIIENNKFLNVLTIFVSLVFSATMFAGIESLLGYFPIWLHVILSFLMLISCVYVTMKGMGGIERFNLFLMPFLFFGFMVVLCFLSGINSKIIFENGGKFGIWYCVLYVALNTAMNVFVFAKQGQKLNKKQTIFACLFSVLILELFLLFANYILLANQESFVSEMPILYISRNNFGIFLLEFIVILIGCFSTLISLCFTLKLNSKKLIKNDYFSIFLSVFLPYFISCIGFSKIISFLYPICSIIGIFIILFSIFFLKQRNNKIH